MEAVLIIVGLLIVCAFIGLVIGGSPPHRPYHRPRRYKRAQGWHDPEYDPEWEELDKGKRKKFYVYVLNTDFGHYVGHSGNLQARIKAHLNDEVPSTAFANPTFIKAMYKPTRKDAAGFEAALKSLRDNRKDRFTEIVGVAPKPFK